MVIDGIEIGVGLATAGIGVALWKAGRPLARVVAVALVALGALAVAHGATRLVTGP